MPYDGIPCGLSTSSRNFTRRRITLSQAMTPYAPGSLLASPACSAMSNVAMHRSTKLRDGGGTVGDKQGGLGRGTGTGTKFGMRMRVYTSPERRRKPTGRGRKTCARDKINLGGNHLGNGKLSIRLRFSSVLKNTGLALLMATKCFGHNGVVSLAPSEALPASIRLTFLVRTLPGVGHSGHQAQQLK